MNQEFLESLSDKDLIDNIKNNINLDASFETLTGRHTGIYIKIVDRYISDQHKNQKQELYKEKDHFIWATSLKYDSERANFCTYLGEMTKYHCMKKMSDKSLNDISLDKHISDENGGQNYEFFGFYDENIKKDVDEQEIKIIIHKAIESLDDDLPKKILVDRFENPKKSWRAISADFGLCHERCRQIYKKKLKELKGKIKI